MYKRQVFEAAERFMVRWYEDEVKLSRKRTHLLSVVSKGMGTGGATVVGKPRLTKAGRRRQAG